MLSKLRRVLFSILSVIVVLAIVLGAVGVYLTRSSFPRTSGEVKLSGLDFPVDIYRDSYGIPNIYAQTTHDLFFAQGYVHAQDRFLADGLLAPYWLGQAIGDVWQVRAGYRYLPAHAGLGARRPARAGCNACR